MNIKGNIKDAMIAGGNITGSNNKNKDNHSANNISINRVRTESAIISFIVGLLSSIIGSWIFSLIST